MPSSIPEEQPGPPTRSFLDFFTNIDDDKRFDLETKVKRLMKNAKSITAAPGDDDTCFLVSSESSKTLFHRININLKTGQVACDVKTCLSYKTFKVCHHSLAVAVQKKVTTKFADWHNKQKVDHILDKMVAFNLPKGTGQKAHKRTQVRLGTAEKTPQIATVKTRDGK